MSYHHILILLARAAMGDSRSTDAGDAGRSGVPLFTLVKLVRIGQSDK
jgi:hypothetical protein